MPKSSLVLGPLLRYVDEVSASIWVETRAFSHVTVTAGERSWTTRTFAAHGHHYALVAVEGLQPGSVTPYTVQIDGAQVWPPANSAFPASVIATLTHEKPLRISFGSCRTSVPHDKKTNRTHGVDALRAYAMHMAAQDGSLAWPDLILFLGDQVYADVTSEAMRQFISAKRDITQSPGTELADFEEYAQLYNLAWSDEANRWLLSTVPTAMIFDDHDIRDDWNASLSWKREMEATAWWKDRIVSGLGSYWVYQHLGNLSPGERADDDIWQQIMAHEADAGAGAELDLTATLDAFAERCDQEPTTYRWSYCRDFGDARLIVIDSRAARVLDPERRSLLDDSETAWLDAHMRGGFRHIFVATSLPFLLPTGLHNMESWDEAISEGAWGPRAARIGENLRQAFDLEHWGAFQKSFREVAGMASEIADGVRGTAPESVVFLSGDVHFSYVAEVERTSGSRIVQAVCSPIRNPLPVAMRSFAAIVAYGIANRLSRRLARSAKVAPPPITWTGLKGPWFENGLATLAVTPLGLRIWWMTGIIDNDDLEHPRMREIAAITVGGRP
ncbi:glycoside hydrolase [Cryobacterium roopkundense]|uniref:Glycoside hydrolase n=1 Tax=Cryobacterium roopkundense TaxID=1001240 RepID=A0A099J3W0_9MICO|nr:alkaline phosphatase D family protein [Cryobacterium roopkundense]KGJ72098.1 glycoside hydrolase [Cryobacterium roopkundense]MBB5640648.1 hypothetical protein [Cryobacterium roopkundense]